MVSLKNYNNRIKKTMKLFNTYYLLEKNKKETEMNVPLYIENWHCTPLNKSSAPSHSFVIASQHVD